MAIVDNVITVIIIALIVLLIWSRIMGQRMIDTFREIVEFVGDFKQEVPVE